MRYHRKSTPRPHPSQQGSTHTSRMAGCVLQAFFTEEKIQWRLLKNSLLQFHNLSLAMVKHGYLSSTLQFFWILRNAHKSLWGFSFYQFIMFVSISVYVLSSFMLFRYTNNYQRKPQALCYRSISNIWKTWLQLHPSLRTHLFPMAEKISGLASKTLHCLHHIHLSKCWPHLAHIPHNNPLWPLPVCPWMLWA